MRNFIQLAVIASFSLMMSCTETTSTTATTNGNSSSSSGLSQTKEEIQEEISIAENSLYNVDKFTFDPVKANAVVASYDKFAKLHPQDEKTPEYLFKSGEIYRSLKKYQKAIDTYEHIYQNHPNFAKAPHSLFLMGFSYENDLKDTDKAKSAYDQFLKKYPDHELAKDVKFSLDNLGVSPEDIIKGFENLKK